MKPIALHRNLTAPRLLRTTVLLLSVPMVIAGAVVMAVAWRRKAPNYHANRAESTL